MRKLFTGSASCIKLKISYNNIKKWIFSQEFKCLKNTIIDTTKRYTFSFAHSTYSDYLML